MGYRGPCSGVDDEARQLAQAVVNYIETHPERMREDGDITLMGQSEFQ
jgi:hypothetical protein